MRSSIKKGLPALLLIGSLSACGVTDPIACTEIFVFGLVVTAVDAETGDPVTDGLQGIAIRESTSSDMTVFENTLRGAGEQPGVYTVVVTAPGYELWTRTGVEVTADECHVQPVELTAALVPAAADPVSTRSD